MRTVSYRLGDLARATINIGKVAENEYTRVQFNAEQIFAEYPAATPSMAVISPAGVKYPAVVTREGDLIIWDVTDADLTAEGMGELQLTLTENGVACKSYIARTRIERSIVADGEAPDPVQNWLDQAAEVLEEVQEAIPAGGTQGQVMGKLSDDDYDIGWIDQTGGGGGSGGTSNYNDLSNKPKINGTTLSGNKSLADLGAASAEAVNAKYTKPASGIPASDLTSGVQTSLGKADTAYQKPSGGVPSSDMAYAVQTSLGKADTAYQKPGSGIPASDIADGVIPDVSGFYTKPQTGIPASDLASGVIPDVSGFYTKPATGIPASDLASGVIPTVHNVPAGGSANQVLAKNSGTDYDMKWVNQSGGGGGAEIDDTAGEGDTTVVWSADKTWTETEALKEAIASFQKDEDGVRLNVAYTPTTGKYIYKDGSIQTGSSFSYTSPIPVKAGDLIEVYAKGYTTNISMIALTDSTGSSYTPAVVSNDSTLKTYSYTAKADGYIACAYSTADGCKVTIHSVDSNKLLDERMVAVEANALIVSALQTDAYLNVIAEGTAATMSQTGKYVDFNGTLQSSGSFNASAAISLPANSTIKFLAKGYTNNVAVLARLNGDGTYTPLIVPADSDEKYFVYTTYDAVNVVISTNKSTSPVYSVYASKIDALDGKMNVIEDDLFAFATMGVIGDSLASGASNYSNGAADRPVYSWGKYIERVYGVETSLFTLGGFSTKNWLTTAQGLPALQAADPLDCYVIGLGQNDQYSYGAQYIGTVADVHVGNESENPDTYFGNYSKIIAAIKAKSPRAKIFCLTNAKEDTTLKADFNNAIKALVPLYTNTYLVDLAADPFYTSREFTDAWYGSHSTAIGYKMIGKNIHDNIVKVMRQKITEFKDIQWIIDDHP